MLLWKSRYFWLDQKYHHCINLQSGPIFTAFFSFASPSHMGRMEKSKAKDGPTRGSNVTGKSEMRQGADSSPGGDTIPSSSQRPHRGSDGGALAWAAGDQPLSQPSCGGSRAETGAKNVHFWQFPQDAEAANYGATLWEPLPCGSHISLSPLQCE